MTTRALAILDVAKRMSAFTDVQQTLKLTRREWEMIRSEVPGDGTDGIAIYRGEVDGKIGVAHGVTLKLAP